MKGFKSTGKGPRSGHSFPKSSGFGPSSGSVKQIAGYSRRAPKKRVMKKAIGGLASNKPHSIGWTDFAKGGKAQFED